MTSLKSKRDPFSEGHTKLSFWDMTTIRKCFNFRALDTPGGYQLVSVGENSFTGGAGEKSRPPDVLNEDPTHGQISDESETAKFVGLDSRQRYNWEVRTVGK